MNKKLLIVGMAVLLLAVGLSGCIDSQSDYVTVQGLLIAAPLEENMVGFYIIEGWSAEMWRDVWTNGSSSDYDSNWTTNSIFILTKNGEMITDSYDNFSVIVASYINVNFSVGHGRYGYLDVIDVTGIVGTIVRENYNDTVNSIEVKSIKMVKKFEWTPPQDDTSKFIGTWILVESSVGVGNITSGMDNHTKETWIFYENESAKLTRIHFMEYLEELNASINIKWIPFESRDGRLYITTQDNYTIWYNYLFSNNDMQLTLSISGFSTQKYNKTES